MPVTPVTRLVRSSLLSALLAIPRAASADEAATTTAEPDDPSCAVERRIGVTEEEAEAIEEIVCGFIRTDPTYAGRYRLRIARAGSKLLVTLRSPTSERFDKRIEVASVDEVMVAAPRLLEAAGEAKPVKDTLTVENVVGGETRVPKKRPSAVHGQIGMIGVSAMGHGTGGGVNMGIGAGTEEWQFVGDLRLAGEAFLRPAALSAAVFTLGTVDMKTSSESFSYVGLSSGVRHSFTNTDVSPFVGGGLALEYVMPEGPRADESAYASYDQRYGAVANAGLAGYLELGVDVLRTRMIGGAITLRGDAPAFTLESTQPDKRDPSKTTRTVAYAPVVSGGVALRF